MEKYDIFISYRRNGGETMAYLLKEKLKQMGFTVFYDVESLRSGIFNDKLYEVIENCRDIILILSENGLDRCINKDDWVRKEIVHGNFRPASGCYMTFSIQQLRCLRYLSATVPNRRSRQRKSVDFYETIIYPAGWHRTLFRQDPAIWR